METVPFPSDTDPRDPVADVVKVGDDEHSIIAQDIFRDLAARGGLGAFGRDLAAQLQTIIDRGGAPEEDDLALKFEREREFIDKARRSQLNQAEGELAKRGTLSSPGIEQGPTRSTIQNIERDLAPEFAGAIRDLLINQRNQNTATLQNSLALATGLASEEAQNMINLADSIGERQQVMSSIAIDVLDRNIAWNQFLAEFGLKRDQALQAAQNGQVDVILTLFQQWLATANQASAGFVGGTKEE